MCAEINFIQKTMEKIDDASTELMMGSGDNVMLRLGGAMFEATEEEATEYCEAEIEGQQEMIDKLVEEESGIIERHDFKEGKSRYEPSTEEHHDHLIDINTGEIIEFVDKDIEELQIKIAKKLGYNLVDHKLELYGSKNKK